MQDQHTASEQDPPAHPLVSVVIATYNRSNALRWAIESVRWQTLDDWELWVIGDACTDDSPVRRSADSLRQPAREYR